MHTHSIVSYDGGITDRQYFRLLQKKVDYVAVTDHNIVNNNLIAQPGLAAQIIPGQEITTSEGDIIGLFLSQTIPSGLTLANAIEEIKAQNGLVYIPHPWEKFRRGLQSKEMETHKNEFDIIEVFNARSHNRLYSELATHFAKKNNIAMASSSDAHGFGGVGSAYTEISALPTRENLVQLLREGKLVCKYAPVSAYFYPVINKVRKYFKR